MNWAGLLQNVLVMVHLRQIMSGTVGAVRVRVLEEQEAGVPVGSLGPVSAPPYQLLTPEYLRLDPRTGNLYTGSARLDREALCPDQQGECALPHHAVVGPSAELIQFSLVLEDINDNPPRFGSAEIHLNVSEDASVGAGFPLDELAEDNDAGANGELRYHLEGGGGGAFRVTVEDGPVLTLVVASPLDRETQDVYRMALVATDRGDVPLSATASVVVKVTDVDDNCPAFEPDSPRRATVAADAPSGTPVVRVRASDPDLGTNAAVSYSLSPKVSAQARDLFSLDRLSGRISLAARLQSDGPKELVLRVQASGPHCPPADTQVTVAVLPVASQQPEIRIRFIAEHRNQTILLPENEPPTVLAILELVGGAAGGRSAWLSLSAEEEEDRPFSLSLQKGRYLLATTRALDYEEERGFGVAVEARGAGGDVLARAALRVAVADVNDNAPRFAQSEYQLEVEENSRAGVVLRVWAQDADGGLNGRVTYRLAKLTAAIFKLHPLTAQLSVSEPLDREQQETHTLTILARDQGSPPLETAATVTLRVLDQNDNAPLFATPHFIFFVPESIPPLAPVGKVGASDRDAGANGEVEVRVVNGSGLFVVDNGRGTLRCTGRVDRERQDRHELRLLATDRGRPSALTSVAKVTVFVEDLNDNEPKVVLPSSNLSCLAVSPTTTAGTTLTKIFAVDEDSGLNSDITYSVEASQPAGPTSPFHLDPRSGNVTLARRLLTKDLGMHHLFVVVSDGGKPTPLHTTVWLNLLVNHTTEPCHLDTVPRSLPYRLAQTPVQPPVVWQEQEGVKRARLVFLVGLLLVGTSVCLFLASVVLYLKQRSRGQRLRQRGDREENMIPLRLRKKYSSGEEE